MKNSLGIIGGVGPLASSYLYEMITKKTKASKDQEHIDIILFSHASIPDRTSYILGESNNSPYPYLLNDCQTLEKLGAKMIVIPCNTSCYFHEELQKNINIPIQNMVYDTVNHIKEKGLKKVAIMATTGTIKSGLYQKELIKNNIDYILPNQDKVMALIYDYVKAGKIVPKEIFEDTIKNLEVEGIILGCTELSVLKKQFNLNSKYIDPLEVETDIILKYFNKERND